MSDFEMSDLEELWSIDPPLWGVEREIEAGPANPRGGWEGLLESFDRDKAIRFARELKARKPESRVHVVAKEEDGFPIIGRWDISTIPTREQER